MVFAYCMHVLFIAYGGEFCEEDRNGCSEVQCFQSELCEDIPAPGFGAVCGECPMGFSGDGEKCSGNITYSHFQIFLHHSNFFLLDIDECMNDTLCEHFCNNTIGGYVCTCENGFKIVNTNQCSSECF